MWGIVGTLILQRYHFVQPTISVDMNGLAELKDVLCAEPLGSMKHINDIIYLRQWITILPSHLI